MDMWTTSLVPYHFARPTVFFDGLLTDKSASTRVSRVQNFLAALLKSCSAL